MNCSSPVVEQDVSLAGCVTSRTHHSRVVQLSCCWRDRGCALVLLDVLDVVDTGRDEGRVFAARDDRLV